MMAFFGVVAVLGGVAVIVAAVQEKESVLTLERRPAACRETGTCGKWLENREDE